jgi:uncharacterized protein YmfQ (DUF2313 family)
MDKFVQSFQHLLPGGYAWPRDRESVLMRVLGGMAAAFCDLEALTEAATVAWRPQETNTRLEEWESAVGLPDACFGASQPVEARRGRVLSRLRGPAGPYLDSSPASLGALEAICGDLGYPAVAAYNHPFRCGRDRVGQRLGLLDGMLYVRMSAQSTPFRAGRNRVGDRLVARPAEVGQLACYLKNYAPARYQLNVIFEG